MTHQINVHEARPQARDHVVGRLAAVALLLLALGVGLGAGLGIVLSKCFDLALSLFTATG